MCTEFTCFTGTKVQALTPEELQERGAAEAAAAAQQRYLELKQEMAAREEQVWRERPN